MLIIIMHIIIIYITPMRSRKHAYLIVCGLIFLFNIIFFQYIRMKNYYYLKYGFLLFFSRALCSSYYFFLARNLFSTDLQGWLATSSLQGKCLSYSFEKLSSPTPPTIVHETFSY